MRSGLGSVRTYVLIDEHAALAAPGPAQLLRFLKSSNCACMKISPSVWGILGDEFLGAVVSDIDDWCRLLPGIVGILVRSKASWGREKIGPIRRIQTPKKKKKPSSRYEAKFTNESERKTEADVRSTNCCVDAGMHALRAAPVHALFSQ